MWYTVSAHLIPDSESKLVVKGETRYNCMLQVRGKAERIVFCGFGKLLELLGSAMGFVAIVTVVVDYLALFCLPIKDRFRASKFQLVNFNDEEKTKTE